MSNQQIKTLPASVKDRLLQISKSRGEDYQFVLVRYASERFLYRLTCSPYQKQFILKGAMLFMIWTKDRYRPTRDIDLLGFGDSSVGTLKKNIQTDLQDKSESRWSGLRPRKYPDSGDPGGSGISWPENFAICLPWPD